MKPLIIHPNAAKDARDIAAMYAEASDELRDKFGSPSGLIAFSRILGLSERRKSLRDRLQLQGFVEAGPCVAASWEARSIRLRLPRVLSRQEFLLGNGFDPSEASNESQT